MINGNLNPLDSLYIIDVTPKSYPLGLDITSFNIIILALNLLISLYINFIGFKKRRVDERSYQMSFDLYKNLIINNLKSIFSHLREVENIIFNTSTSNLSGDALIKNIEDNFEKIEESQSKFNLEVLPFIYSFSDEMAEKLKFESEKFYDELANILSKLNNVSSKNNKKVLAYFVQLNELYKRKIIELVKDYRPKIS